MGQFDWVFALIEDFWSQHIKNGLVVGTVLIVEWLQIGLLNQMPDTMRWVKGDWLQIKLSLISLVQSPII